MIDASTTRPQTLLASGARLGAGALVLAAVGYQLAIQIRDRPEGIVNFFSFFTIESNLFAAAVLFLTVARGTVARGTVARGTVARGMAGSRTAPRPHWLDLLRGASTLYMTTTGIVFAVLLSGIEVQLTVPWVDTVLHKLMPVIILLDWLLDPPRQPVQLKQALRWLVFPVVWTLYTLVRGPIVDWYPYPFIDPRLHGYGSVALTFVVITLGALLLILALRWLANRLRTRSVSRSR